MYSYNTVVVNSKLLTTSIIPDTSPDISSIFYSDGTDVPSGPGLYILPAGTITPQPIATGGGSGTVTSVALSMPGIFSVSGSPVTMSGTLTAALVSQSANTVFASPNGSAGIPSFRTLVLNDIPTIPNSKLQNSSISAVVNSSGTDIAISPTVSLGGTLTLSVPDANGVSRGVVNTTTQTFGGQKTFSTPPIFSSIATGRVLFSGISNVVSGSSNLFWDSSNNRLGIGTTTPTNTLHIVGSMRLTGALSDSSNSVGTSGQVLSSTGTSTSWITPNAGTVTSVALTAPPIFSVTGSPVTSSGTIDIALTNQSSNRIFAGPISGGPAIPSFRVLVVGDLPIGIPNANLQNSTITLNTGTAGTDLNISGSPVSLGGAVTINIPSASTTARGLVTTTSQTFAGAKTFSSAVTISSTLVDGFSSPGSSGLFLSSTGTGVQWTSTPQVNIYNSDGELRDNRILKGNAFDLTMTDIGNLTFESNNITLKVSSTITMNAKFIIHETDSYFNAAVYDVSSNPGSPGDILYSNGTSISWGAPPSAVTSVGLSAPSIFSVSGSPVTSAGTLTLALVNQNANTFFAGPNTGLPAVPTFRTLVVADLPTNIPNANLQNSSISVNSGSTGTDVNISGSPVSLGGAVTINIPSASATARGLVTTGAQTFSGDKIFGNSVRMNNTLLDNSGGPGTSGQILSSTGTGISWISIPDASVSQSGVVNLLTQEFAGQKIFSAIQLRGALTIDPADTTNIRLGTINLTTAGNNNTIIGSLIPAGTTINQRNILVGQAWTSLNTAISGSVILCPWGFNGGVTASGYVAIGNQTTVSSSSCVAIGGVSTASGTGAIAIGQTSTASSGSAIAIGQASLANATSAIAIGQAASSTGIASIVIGQGSATAADSIAIGRTSGAVGNNSIAIGVSANALTVNSIALGNTAGVSINTGGIAIGANAQLAAQDAICVGRAAVISTTTATASICIGLSSTSSGISCIALGQSAQTLLGTACIAIGRSASANANGGIAIGDGASTTNIDNLAIGRNAATGVAYGIQLGQGTNSATSATCRFRSQTIATEGWIGGGTTTASIDNSGNIIRTPSDVRLKTEIVDLPVQESIDIVMGCRPRRFRYNELASDLGSDLRVGLIAQELDEVAPSLVNKSSYIKNNQEAINSAVIDFSNGLITHEEFLTRLESAKTTYWGLRDGEIIFHLMNVLKYLLSG